MTDTPPSTATHSKDQCEQMWATYCQAWSATTTPQRQHLLSLCLTPTFQSFDRHVHHYSDMEQQIEQFQSRVANAVLRTNSVRVQDRFAAVEWECADASGVVVLSGVDFVEFAADGRMERIVPFLN